MPTTSRPAWGAPPTHTPTATPRAPRDAAQRYAPPYPPLATARHVAALSYRLPGGDPSGPARVRHVEALAAALSWSDKAWAVQVWRLADWAGDPHGAR